MITATREDYLRAMYALEQKHARGIGVLELADTLGLAKSTVSERLQELAGLHLIQYQKYAPLRLTKKGSAVAKKLTYKHRLIEVFLHATLHLPRNKVHAEAHKLEHAFSDEVTERLRAFLGNPHVDPHGSPILK